jgi:hypothetical protein
LNIQALKGLVIGLGVLIIIGFALLVYAFYTRLSERDSRAAGEPAATHQPAATRPSRDALAQSFGEKRIPLSEGCTIVEMRPDGHRLYLRTGPMGLCEQVIVIDSATGAVLGTVVLRP